MGLWGDGVMGWWGGGVMGGRRDEPISAKKTKNSTKTPPIPALFFVSHLPCPAKPEKHVFTN